MFRHTTVISNVDVRNVHNTYVDKTVVRPVQGPNHAFNGPGGSMARPGSAWRRTPVVSFERVGGQGVACGRGRPPHRGRDSLEKPGRGPGQTTKGQKAMVYPTLPFSRLRF